MVFERGDIVSAIDYAKIAIAADDTWGYPEYLLGWYGLFTKGVDSVFHFTNAVRSDWSFLQRIKKDRMCCKWPDMVHQVQKRCLT